MPFLIEVEYWPRMIEDARRSTISSVICTLGPSRCSRTALDVKRDPGGGRGREAGSACRLHEKRRPRAHRLDLRCDRRTVSTRGRAGAAHPCSRTPIPDYRPRILTATSRNAEGVGDLDPGTRDTQGISSWCSPKNVLSSQRIAASAHEEHQEHRNIHERCAGRPAA
jgi:hypothetical protein